MGITIKYDPVAKERIERYQERYSTNEKPSWAMIQEMLVASGFQEMVLPIEGTQLTRAQVKHLYKHLYKKNKIMPILPVVEAKHQCNNSV